MSNRKKLIISIFSLIFCILVTFAWINELQNPEGRVLALRFNDAAIASSELQVKLSVNEEGETYNDITRLYEEDVNQSLESFDDFAPGCRKKFRLDITNLSSSSTTLRIILSDIICEEQELCDSIIIGTNGFSGFTSTYPAPKVQTKILSDGMNDTTSFTLLDSVDIPPHNVNEPVSIYFYVMFSAAGSENLENKSFTIGTINFLTI